MSIFPKLAKLAKLEKFQSSCRPILIKIESWPFLGIPKSRHQLFLSKSKYFSKIGAVTRNTGSVKVGPVRSDFHFYNVGPRWTGTDLLNSEVASL